MSDLASVFSCSSKELKDDVSQGRNEPTESEAVEGKKARLSGHNMVLSFPRTDDTDASRADGEPASLDPVAHPAYQARVEGVTHPINQFGEEPLQAKPLKRTISTPSSKTELDIRAFVDAVAAAFPKPRDPQMARVLRARPKRAARPFLYLAEEQGAGSEIPAAGQSASHADIADPGRSAEISRAEISRSLDLLLYDPILEGTALASEVKVPSAMSAAKAKPQVAGKAAGAGVWTPGMRDRRSRKRDAAPVQAHERPLIEALIEPKDPVAKPRLLPVLDETVPGVPARLSPFQRAQLQRPKTVRDCHGRMTVVEYRVELTKSK